MCARLFVCLFMSLFHFVLLVYEHVPKGAA